ncbi:CDP-glycerol glycerophosphotransferase family protein [Amphibacillus cookii]|uniref:CDP-glycerol glycerophosphotransferase family protein n=1 Tax=Amphibacillus cookii TaxID=767787 RepID=UPI001957F654|nr:CDP-glycerol glycerophosphotransferase family protein [Amphibacillus cookii]MBM7543084.1 CDP-glycerol glycerophosphotransferase [Amphibacillus cookii]
MKKLIFNFFRKNVVPKLYYISFSIISLLPKDEKLVIFESFLGKQFSDNPRAIYEYMSKHFPDYKLYWSFNKSIAKQHAQVKSINRLSFKWLLYMGRAKYWITNSRLPLWIPKPKSTIYVQTWHGTPLKKLGVDIEDVKMPGTTTLQYKHNFTKEASKWDYLVSPNRYSTDIFRRAFHFDQEIIEVGYPRNDCLINSKDNTGERLTKLGLPQNKKVILYAPTWRDNQYFSRGKYSFNLELDLDNLNKELGDEFIVLLRMHYLVSENLNIDKYKGFVYDFSSYSDISDLYLISDLLITDYSSVFFDYANLRRPIIFFVYDLEAYRQELRGFYLDFEQIAPGPLIQDNDQLLKELKQIDFNRYSPPEKYEAFITEFCSLENGRATAQVVDTILHNK